MEKGVSHLDKDYRYTNFQKGELVQIVDRWSGPSGLPAESRTGIILEVNPRNVYDSESCDIFTSDEQFIIVDIKSLRRLSSN